jgi:hypothetical protein
MPQRLHVKPMARIVGQATAGLAPKYVLMTPVEAVRRSVTRLAGLSDGRSIRAERGFAVQAIARAARAGPRCQQGQRHGRRRRTRPSDRRERRAGSDDACFYALEAARVASRHWRRYVSVEANGVVWLALAVERM